MKNQTGFTLLELMITVVLLGIVATIAVPNFTLLIRSNQVTTQTNDLLTALQQARTEALRRGGPVTVCASSNQATCNVTGNNWHLGWIIVADNNLTGNPSIDEVIRAGGGASGPIQAASASAFVRFMGNGTRDTSTTAGNITFLIDWPDCRGDRARSLSINAVGRARSAEENCDA